MASITFFGGIHEIGGNKILLHDGNGHRLFLDFGRGLGHYGMYYGGFTKSRSNSGARDLLKLGVIPKIDGIYRKCLIDMHVDTLPASAIKGRDVERDAFKKARDYWQAPDLKSYEAWAQEHDGTPFVDAVLLTHAHYDHVQDITFLSEFIPIYCTRETKALVKAISDVSNITADIEFYRYSTPNLRPFEPESKYLFKIYFPKRVEIDKPTSTAKVTLPLVSKSFDVESSTPGTRDYRTPEPLVPFAIGGFTVTLVPTDHSIAGACAYVVEVGGKRIVYTGDIRFHGRGPFSISAFCAAVKQPVDVLVIEGTRVESTSKLTELDVERNLIAEIKAVRGLVLVDFGWKDVDRFMTARNAAVQAGRTLLITPKLAFLLSQLHLLDGTKYPDPTAMDGVRVYLHRQEDMLYSPDDYKTTDAGYLETWGRNRSKSDENLKRIKERVDAGSGEQGDVEAWALATHHFTNGIRAYQVREVPSKYVLMFSYWNVNELLDLSDLSNKITGGKYIRASCEPFNDEMLVDEGKLMTWLKEFSIGYDTEINEDGGTIFKRNHVSGHASRPELEELVEVLKPKVVYPIHTQHPERFREISPAGTAVVDGIEAGKEYLL